MLPVGGVAAQRDGFTVRDGRDAGMDVDEQELLEEVEAAVDEWRERHEPVTREAWDAVNRRWMRVVGRSSGEAGWVGPDNPHLIAGMSEVFWGFADREGAAVVEVDDTVRCGELMGVPVEEGWVPVVFCLDETGEWAVNRMAEVEWILHNTVDGRLLV